MKITKVSMENIADQLQARLDNGATSVVAFVVLGNNSMEMVEAGHPNDETLNWVVEDIYTELESLL